MGRGTEIKRVERVHDGILEARVNSNITSEEFFKEKLSELERIEAIFNQGDEEGLDKIFGMFFNSFRELSMNPESETLRSVVKDRALMVVKDFNMLHEELNVLQEGIDTRIYKEVADLNELLDNISDMNGRIIAGETDLDQANDLRDRRDLLVRELAKLISIHTYEDNVGNFIVHANNIGSLVIGPEVQKLMVARPGGVPQLAWKDAPNTFITSSLKDGSLAGLFQIRDTSLKSVQNGVDALAYTLVKSVNEIHSQGFVAREIPMIGGFPVGKDRFGPTSGIDFFMNLKEPAEAARLIDINPAIKDDLSNLVTALSPNRPGDNRVALEIAKLDGKKLMNNGQSTMDEHYLKLIGTIGAEVGKTQINLEQMTGIRAQGEAIKERVSGVSIDEETTNIMRYQQGYEAAAKVLKTANDMMDTILSLK
jgi:flagellar hook-associated protein 1 FlgK